MIQYYDLFVCLNVNLQAKRSEIASAHHEAGVR